MKYFTEFNGKLNKRTEKYKNGKTHNFCTDIICFDIETASLWLDSNNEPILFNDNGVVRTYKEGYPAEYWNDKDSIGLPYIWQCSINTIVYYGREFTDFLLFIDKFPKNIDIIIWVHNLAFEFQFLCNLFKWKKIFARAPHKVITAMPKKYSNITFRCTYFLTRLSLASWGKQLNLPKLIGDLDYNVLRTPYTEMSDTELGYCERDTQVMYAGIKQLRQRYGTLENIPLTQTGTVRREVKNRLVHNFDYLCHIKSLIPKSAEEYALLQKLFAGGYTHASRLYAGNVIKGLIQHFDFASAYPYQMLAQKYPDTPWSYIRIKEVPSDFEDYAYIFHVKLTNLVCVTFNSYIQASKISNAENATYDNGRILSADSLEIWITEQDYIIISRVYTYDMEILHCYKSKKAYLPKPFLEYLLELYNNKTALKGIPEKEDIYLQSKQYINSMFGMMVTAIMQSDVEFKDNVWSTKLLRESDIESKLRELRNLSMTENHYFLSYSWGIYVTAYCRRCLWDCIIPYDDTVLYSDTDSAFILGDADFSAYNEEVHRKVVESCKINELDIEKTRPADKKGIKHPIGVFEREHDCTEFITLGAKRYCYRDAIDNELHLTISGINKEAVKQLDNNIANFKDGFIFDKDHKSTKKKLLLYSCDQPTVIFPDGYESVFSYGIAMRNNGYKLSITNEYADLIQYMETGDNVITDADYISRRGRFKRERK